MQFTPLRISTIKPKREITFDLYIFFKEQYLLYIKTGKALEEDHLAKLKKQKIARFFITDTHEPKYQAFLDDLLDEAINNDDVPVEEKASLTEGAACTAIERMQEDPGNKTAYNMTEKAASSLRHVVCQNSEAMKIIAAKKVDESDLITKHNINVSVLASKLGEKEGLPPEELDNLAVAGLLHDLGLTKLPHEHSYLFTKIRSEFTPEEKKIWNTHPKASAELLNDKSYINASIIELILNHEEKLSGNGPQKKKKLSRHEEILSLCDCYDTKVTACSIPPKDAVKQLKIDELGNYDLELINKFQKLLKSEGILAK